MVILLFRYEVLIFFILEFYYDYYIFFLKHMEFLCDFVVWRLEILVSAEVIHD